MFFSIYRGLDERFFMPVQKINTFSGKLCFLYEFLEILRMITKLQNKKFSHEIRL